MIQEKANVQVDIDGQAAGQRIEKLTAQTREWRKELREIKKAGQPVDPNYLDELKRKIKDNEREVRSYKKQLTDVNYVMKNLSKVSEEDLGKAMKRLRTEIKKSSRATKEERVELEKKKAQYKAIGNELDKVRMKSQANSLSLGKIADGFNRYMGMGTALIGSLVGVVLGFRQLNDITMEFEERVDNLGALTGLAGEELAWLEENAKKTSVAIVEGGIRIKQGATDIVDAYTKMGSQRPELLKNKEALAAVTQDGILLSEAAKSKLDPAISALANTMNQFNLQANESRRVINVLAAGSKEGAGDIPYLSAAIEKAGTTFDLMGVSVERGVGIIEAVAPKFKKAELAGNSLDKVFLKMKDQQIGYATGVFDVNDAIDELVFRFQNGESASSIFGVEHAKMVEILVQSKSEMNRYTEAVTGTNIALEQAYKNTNNQAAILAQARNEYQLTAMELGKELGPAITMSTNGFTYFMKALVGGIHMFGEYRDEIAAVTTGLIVYGTAIKAELILTKTFAAVAWLAQKAILAFNWAMKSNPIPFLASAIIGLIVYMTDFTNKTTTATKEQKKLNDELENFQELTDDLDTDFYINIIYEYGNNFDEWTKKASKKELTRMKSYLEKYVADANRHIKNLGVGDEDEREIYEEGLATYKKYLSALIIELDKFKEENNIRVVPESAVLEGQRNLAELEKQLKAMEELQKRMSEAKIPDNPEEEPADDVDLSYALKQYEESFEGRRAILDAFYKGGVIGKQEYADKIKELDDEIAAHEAQTIEPQKEKLQEKFKNYLHAAREIASVYQTWANLQTENDRVELSNYEDLLDQKKEQLQKQLKDGTMSQKQYDAQIAQIDKKADDRQKDMANKQAKRNKTAAIFNAIIGTAQAVLSALKSPVGYPANLVLAAIAGALGAVQIGIISRQKVPQYNTGTWDVIGADDGRKYKAKQGSYGTQIVDGPTMIPGIGLVGEGYKPKEIIFSGEDSTRIMNSPALVEAINYTIRTPQFAGGNYPDNYVSTTNSELIFTKMEDILLAILEENKKKKTVNLPYTDLLEKNSEYEKLMKDVVVYQ